MSDKETVLFIYKFFMPQLIVSNDLYDLYIENEYEAIEKVLTLINEDEEEFKQIELLTYHNFTSEVNDLRELINSLSDEIVEKHKTMFLIHSITIFENMVNLYLQQELMTTSYLEKEDANRLLSKLGIEEKVGCFLKLIVNEDLTKNNVWSKIKPSIKARNFFVHYKPQDSRDYDKHRKNIAKKTILDLITAMEEAYDFLNEIRSDDSKDYNTKLEAIRSLMEERHKNSKVNGEINGLNEKIENLVQILSTKVPL
jgi:hypothetical protein